MDPQNPSSQADFASKQIGSWDQSLGFDGAQSGGYDLGFETESGRAREERREKG